MTVPEPIDHPAAWRGQELFERPDWQIELTAADRDEIAAATTALGGASAEQFTASDFPLPNLSNNLLAVRESLEHGCGAAFVRGFDSSAYSEEECRQIFWGLMSHVGTPVSQSASGERIFSVRDEGFRSGDSKARGPNTSKRLSFHTDRCDVIAFLTLRQAKSGGENQLVSSIALFNEIRVRRPDLLEVLMQPFYYQRHNVDSGNERPWTRQPIFSIFNDYFACNFLRVLIERASLADDLPSLTPQQIEAMDFLESVAAEPEMHVTFRQEPGDILLVNNWVLLHRRNQFVDHDDPALRRHLLRIWLSVPNSRPLHPDFRGNYGNTAAGAIRGGMHPSER